MTLLFAMAFAADVEFAPAATAAGYVSVRDGADVAFRGELGLRVLQAGRLDVRLTVGVLPNHEIAAGEDAWRYAAGGDLSVETLFDAGLVRVGPLVGLQLRSFGQWGLSYRTDLMPQLGLRLDVDLVQIGPFSAGLGSRWLTDLGRTSYSIDGTWVGDLGIATGQFGLQVGFDPKRRE